MLVVFKPRNVEFVDSGEIENANKESYLFVREGENEQVVYPRNLQPMDGIYVDLKS